MPEDTVKAPTVDVFEAEYPQEIPKPLFWERLSFECRKTKSKVITPANQKGHRQPSEPIKTRSNYM